MRYQSDTLTHRLRAILSATIASVTMRVHHAPIPVLCSWSSRTVAATFVEHIDAGGGECSTGLSQSEQRNSGPSLNSNQGAVHPNASMIEVDTTIGSSVELKKQFRFLTSWHLLLGGEKGGGGFNFVALQRFWFAQHQAAAADAQEAKY